MARIVEVRNVGVQDFSDSFNSQPYSIPAGGRIMCEEEVASTWLGWPGFRDDPRKDVMDRTNCVARLRLRYGWHVGMGMTDEDWEELRPKLEVYTVDGERIYMVLDDPEGKHGQVVFAESNEVEIMKSMYERQQAELEALRQRLDDKERAPDATDDIPTDDPRKMPVRSAKRGAIV